MPADPENNPYLPPASDPVPPAEQSPADGASERKPDLRIKDPRSWGWAAISFIWLSCLAISLREIRLQHPAWLGFLGLALVVTGVAAMVSYLVWFFQVAANAKIISPNSGPSPGWAIGCHFIPFLNWVMPALFMKEIADASFRPRPPKATGYVVAVWWAAFMIRNLVLSFQPTSIFVPVLSWVAGIGAAWLIIRITLKQVEWRESGLPAGPRPVMLATGGPRPVSATRLPHPVRQDAPVPAPRPPSRPGAPAEVRVVPEPEEF